MKHTLESLQLLASTPEGVQQIRVMVAELEGYEFTHFYKDHHTFAEVVVIRKDGVDFGLFFQSDYDGSVHRSPQMAGVPNYPADLNAVHEVEMKLPITHQVSYWSFLEQAACHPGNTPIIFATALQRCIALIITLQP